jgi:predicted nuclease of predicted toxin-antitoxin system
MRFLCDVHISIKISKRIQELGYDSQHVNFILDRWHSKDLAIAEFANHHDLILISKDQDFRNSFLLSQKPKIDQDKSGKYFQRRVDKYHRKKLELLPESR